MSIVGEFVEQKPTAASLQPRALSCGWTLTFEDVQNSEELEIELAEELRAAIRAEAPQEEQEDAGAFLERLGDDGMKWAEEFRAACIRLGYSDMPVDWLFGWFANAIEHSDDHRRWWREKNEESAARCFRQMFGEREWKTYYGREVIAPIVERLEFWDEINEMDDAKVDALTAMHDEPYVPACVQS